MSASYSIFASWKIGKKGIEIPIVTLHGRHVANVLIS